MTVSTMNHPQETSIMFVYFRYIFTFCNDLMGRRKSTLMIHNWVWWFFSEHIKCSPTILSPPPPTHTHIKLYLYLTLHLPMIFLALIRILGKNTIHKVEGGGWGDTWDIGSGVPWFSFFYGGVCYGLLGKWITNTILTVVVDGHI